MNLKIDKLEETIKEQGDKMDVMINSLKERMSYSSWFDPYTEIKIKEAIISQMT